MNLLETFNFILAILFLMASGAAIALERMRGTPAGTAPGEGIAGGKGRLDGKGGAGGKGRSSASGDFSAWILAHRELVIFLGLMFVAFLLRIWKFGSVPYGMNQDGAMAAVDAKALADHGTDRFGMFFPAHFTAWGYAQMSVLLSYCMVPFFKLFGMNVIMARLPMLLASMGGLAALYFIAKRLLGVWGAQVTLVFAACNPWHFMQSRWALDCNLLPHVFLIGLCFMLKGVSEKRRWLYVSMAIFALCLYCYGIAFYVVPVFLLVMALYLVAKKLVRAWEALLCVLVFGLVSWPVCLTMAINAFGWKTIRTFFCTMPYFQDSVRSKDILFFCDDKMAQLKLNFEALKNVYWNGDNLPWNTVPGFGVITRCFLPFVLLGICACVKRILKETDPLKKAGFVSVLTFFAVGNLSGFITAQVNVNRINILHYSLLLLGGMGMVFMIRNVRRSSYVVFASLAVISILFLRTYFTSHAETLQRYYYHDFLEALEFVGDEEQSACTRFVITPDTQYNGAVMVTEILTLFAHDVDAELFQGKTLDENGLSYSDKYRYENADVRKMDPSQPVAYVMKTADLSATQMMIMNGSGENGYSVTVFGDYCAVIPWRWLRK